MAYFSNETEGEVLDEQCSRCKWGKEPCPIFWAQCNWNYDACNNKTVREILDSLISNKGECSVYKIFENDLKKEG